MSGLAGRPNENLLCIDSYENKQIAGTFLNEELCMSESFSSLMQLVLLIERTLEQNQFPKPYVNIRAFEKRKKPDPIVCEAVRSEFKKRTGALATFRVKILFRQNASWQGLITWVEGGCEEAFRSCLEMLFLIDNALTAGYMDEAGRASNTG